MNCDLAAPKCAYSTLLSGLPRTLAPQCEPCRGASWVCFGKLARAVSPSLKPPSVICAQGSYREVLWWAQTWWQCGLSCSWAQLSQPPAAPAGISRATSPEWLLLLFPPQEPPLCPRWNKIAWLQTGDTESEIAEGRWLQKRPQSADGPSKMTFLQPDSSNVIIPTNYFHDLI